MRFKLFVFLLFSSSLVAQTFTPKVNFPVTLVGAGSLITGSIVLKNTPALTVEDIKNLDRNKLSFIDRNATYNYSKSADKASTILQWSSVALPLTTLAVPNGRQNVGSIAILTAENFLFSTGVNFLTKSLVKRVRPFVYNPDAPMSEKLKKDARLSFYSGHTNLTSASCFFTASIINQTIDNKSTMPFIWASASIVPAVTGYLRWKAGKHFPTDVLVGYILGMASGFLVSELH